MKIIFQNFLKGEIELSDVKPETTLRDIIHFYESKTGYARGDYRFIINNKTLPCNQNSLMTLEEYFKSVHGLNKLTEEVIRISANPHCGTVLTLTWMKRADIEKNEQQIERNSNANTVICGITLEIISGKPIKINNRFYDYDAFYTYMLNERQKYFLFKKEGKEYDLICPLRQKLPEDICKVITDPMLTSMNSVLDHNFFNCVEEYEDLIAKMTTKTLGI